MTLINWFFVLGKCVHPKSRTHHSTRGDERLELENSSERVAKSITDLESSMISEKKKVNI